MKGQRNGRRRNDEWFGEIRGREEERDVQAKKRKREKQKAE